jgi:hypothetical protein
MRKAAVLLVMLLTVLINYTFAQKPAVVTSNEAGWHKIGEVTASFKMQNESIAVLGADRFKAIRLKVTDAPINIDRIQVFYENGDMEDFNVANTLQEGDETRTLDLKGTTQELKKVVFTYKTLPNFNNEKAHVELYGLKSGKDNGESYREEKNESKAEEAREESKEERDRINNDAKKTESDIEKGVNKTGDAISEAAAKGVAEVKDKVYADKVGPKGQRIYIDKHSKYYYVNGEGKKVYVSKLELKDKH